MTADIGSTRGGTPPQTRALWRAVALPVEHGGWGLTLEPVVLGLLVAPSLAGAAIGVGAFVAFAARTPSKVVLVDLRRHRVLARTRLARRIAVVELAVLALLLGLATWVGDPRFWIPLLLAVPLVCVQLWFDARSRSRRLAPELAGTVGMGSVAAAIAIAGDASSAAAAGAWLVVAARAVVSLPFVHFQLGRVNPHHVARLRDVVLSAVVGVALTAFGVTLGWLAWPALAAVAALVLVQLGLTRARAVPAVVVGVQQLAFGLVVVVIAGLTMP